MMQSVKHSTAEMGAVVRGMSRFDSLNVLEQIQVEHKQQPSVRKREIVHRPSLTKAEAKVSYSQTANKRQRRSPFVRRPSVRCDLRGRSTAAAAAEAAAAYKYCVGSSGAIAATTVPP